VFLSPNSRSGRTTVKSRRRLRDQPDKNQTPPRTARRDKSLDQTKRRPGSSRPGLIITGIFNGMAGSQSELTAGELLGMTSPRLFAVDKAQPPAKPRVQHRRSSPRVRPLRMVSFASAAMIFAMLRRTMTHGKRWWRKVSRHTAGAIVFPLVADGQSAVEEKFARRAQISINSPS